MTEQKNASAFADKTKRQEVELMEGLRFVEREYKVPFGKQVREIFALSRNHISLTAQEYYYYGLFRQDMSIEQKKQFVGDEMQRAIFIACNRMSAWQLAADKMYFYIRMQAEGFAVPQCYAQIQPRRSTFTCAHFTEKEAFREWFFSEMPLPAFCKPVDSASGAGAFLVNAIDKATGEFIDGKGDVFPFEALWELAEQYMHKGGMVVQEALRVHPDLVALASGQLATVRIVVCLKDSGPEITNTAWRTPCGDSVVDNFSFAGNFYSLLDAETGEVLRVKRSAAIPQDVPDSPLLGTHMPLWQEAKERVLEAALLFPDLRLQSWDIALTDKGVVFVEMNPGGSIGNCQIVTETGAWQGDFIEFVRKAYQDNVNDSLAYPRKKVKQLLFG